MLPEQHTPEEYALLFQQGAEEALSFFYKELHPALSLYANSILQNREIAEEIASDAFIKTWRHHEKLDSFNAIRAYLYRCVYNDALYNKQKVKRRNEVEVNATASETNADTPFDHTVRAETYRLIHAALKDLAPGNQKVIKMYFLDGKTSGEIARELKLSTSTVKWHKSRALAALRKRFLQMLFLVLP